MRRIFLFALIATMFAACGGSQASSPKRQRAAPGRRAIHIKLRQPSIFLRASSRGLATTATAATTTSQASPSTTLSQAVSTAKNGTVIHLDSGSYPQISDSAARTGWVTVSGEGDATPPQIDGAMLWGAHDVRFVDVKFTNMVYINRSPDLGSTQIAYNIQILNSEIDCGATSTTPLLQGIFVRGGSRNVTISGDYIHNCVNGFISQAQDPVTENVILSYDRFSDFSGDAIDLGGLTNVTISHDVITNMSDPAAQFHNDGIQFFGNNHNVDVTDNVISNSRNQLIFIQDAIAGTLSGDRSNTNILIAHNLIFGAGAVAVQDQGGQAVRFVGNTMWDNFYGSLWLRPSSLTNTQPQNTLIVDNIIEGLQMINVSRLPIESHNLIDGGPNAYTINSTGAVLVNPTAPSGYQYGVGDLVDVNPDFVDEASGDFRVAPSSPASASGTAAYPTLLSDSMDPDPTVMSSDMTGSPISTPVAIGAIQAADPSTSYGAPAHTAQNAPAYH